MWDSATAARCHPLTVLDDHSRYSLCLQACANEQGSTVQNRLEATFRRYGLPEAFFVRQRHAMGRCLRPALDQARSLAAQARHRALAQPALPPAEPRQERFHRTLKAEVLALRRLRDLAEAQRAFDLWCTIYNLERPHEALNQDVPASRYRPSLRPMPDRLPQAEYDVAEIVRTIPSTKDYISFKGRHWKVPQAFRGERAIPPLTADGRYGVFFAAHQIARIDLTNDKCVGDVSEQVSVMSPD